jgi:prepilin-type N-terminal cleavage/methylation domain-containing protein
MKENRKTINNQGGFSLAEMLAALTISAMVLAAVVGIYSRAEHTANAVTSRLDSPRLPSEILQRIAEDFDRTIAADSDTRITIENKFDRGLPTARLTIRRTISDGKNREQIFEQIIWQGHYDYETGSGGLVLYRSHTGMTLEDKLLDEKREDWEKAYSFVPICTGVTFFRIQVILGENLRDTWTSPSLPTGVKVTISFAEPFKTARGTMDVPEAEKITRIIAIGRTRKIKFEIPVTQEQEEQTKQEEQQKSDEKQTNK